jgi:uncharacterized membrane protein YbaN (DUF454 family)
LPEEDVEQTQAGTVQPSVLRSPRRLLLAAAGVVCVALAAAGAVLPGMPATVFLLAASYLFTRSCPWLEQRLLRSPLFRPYLPYVDGSRPLPLRARIGAMAAMWLAVGSSLALLGASGRLVPWVAVAIVVAAVAGTVAIARFRRG